MILGPIDLPSNLTQQTLGTIENQSRAGTRAINSTNSRSGVQANLGMCYPKVGMQLF